MKRCGRCGNLVRGRWFLFFFGGYGDAIMLHIDLFVKQYLLW